MNQDELLKQELLRLFPSLRAPLVASLTRLVGLADAEDLAEETLLRALAAIASFRGEAALGTWLHRIAINLAHDLLRRRSISPVVPAAQEIEITETTDSSASVIELLEQRQMSRCVQALLTQLPPQQRQMLVQTEIFERSALKIAKEEDITAGNAKIRLHRARRAIKAALETQCDFHYQETGVLCCTPKT